MAQRVKSSAVERISLSRAVPLSTPLAVHIFPAYTCNFKCFYCVHSLDDKSLSKIISKEKMTMDTFKNAINGIEFDQKLKTLIFAGHGEPLLNKNISEMIAYACEKDIAENTELVTNGYLLSNEVSRDIINSGLKSIRISIQGTSSRKYREITGVDVNYDRLLERISYFYQNKKQCSVYIKIVDSALEGQEDLEYFYSLFEGICDRIAVEHVVPTAHGVEYGQGEYYSTQQGFELQKPIVCPSPFYMLVIEPDGSVRPCCATKYPLVLGNVNKEKISDIWNSENLLSFQGMQLKGKRNEHSVCKNCNLPDFGMQPGDNLDSNREELLLAIGRLI